MKAQHLQNGCVDCTHNLTRKAKRPGESFRGNVVEWSNDLILEVPNIPQNYDPMPRMTPDLHGKVALAACFLLCQPSHLEGFCFGLGLSYRYPR